MQRLNAEVMYVAMQQSNITIAYKPFGVLFKLSKIDSINNTQRTVSAFGKNTSAIGVTVNKTLNPKSPDYRWEDKGIVVISRNVDVLVSKLRKKLSDDPSIKFINVHGRGYKLMIG